MATATPPPNQGFDDLFQGVSEASRQFWTRWRVAPPSSAEPDQIYREMDQSFLDGLQLSERLVRQTIEMEKTAVNRWCESVITGEGRQGDARALVQQWREVMNSWMDLRASAWNQWFEQIRKLEQEALPIVLRNLDRKPGEGPEVALAAEPNGAPGGTVMPPAPGVADSGGHVSPKA